MFLWIRLQLYIFFQIFNIFFYFYPKDDYVPFMESLPLYVLRIATEVEWNSEKDCFQTFCRETAKFYAIPEKIYEDPDEEVCLFYFLKFLNMFKVTSVI